MGWFFLFFLAAGATIAGFIASLVLAAIIDDCSKKKMDNKDITVLVITMMVMLHAAANTAVYNMTPSQNVRIARFAEAASLHGFSSGSEYPLEVGARSVSAEGEVAVSGGLFSVSAYAKMQAGASILVDYQHGDGTHEVLEIPLSTIKFNIIDDNKASSMVINFVDMPGAEGYTAKDTLSNCHPSIQWGWWLRECTTVESTRVTSTIGDEGLSGLLQKALTSNPGKFVVMNVTRAEYQQILGSADSTETQTETPTPSPAH